MKKSPKSKEQEKEQNVNLSKEELDDSLGEKLEDEKEEKREGKNKIKIIRERKIPEKEVQGQINESDLEELITNKDNFFNRFKIIPSLREEESMFESSVILLNRDKDEREESSLSQHYTQNNKYQTQEGNQKNLTRSSMDISDSEHFNQASRFYKSPSSEYIMENRSQARAQSSSNPVSQFEREDSTDPEKAYSAKKFSEKDTPKRGYDI